MRYSSDRELKVASRTVGAYQRFSTFDGQRLRRAAVLGLVLMCLGWASSAEARLVFRLDRAGRIRIQNAGTAPLEFDSYLISDTRNLLVPQNWNSITQQAQTDPAGVLQRLGPNGLTFGVELRDNGSLRERAIGGPVVLAAGDGISLGNPFLFPSLDLPNFGSFRDYIHGPTVAFRFSTTGGGEIPAEGLWEPLAGDINQDTSVDINDFVVLRNNFGLAAAGVTGEWTAALPPEAWTDTDFDAIWGKGDMDFSLKVDLGDFIMLRNNFGLTAGGLPANALAGTFANPAAVAGVPEPRAWIAMLCLFSILAAWRMGQRTPSVT